MEKVRKISREYYLRQIVACWLVTCMLFAIPAQVAMAVDWTLPTGEVVVPGGGGVGGFDRGTDGQLHITDVADGTIIEWDTFDIGSSALTQFHQLDVDFAVLNRITGGGPASEILGDLIANGRVFIINPAGIVFGEGATINVAQLVASSLDILNDDFRNGLPYTFTGGATAGDVINYATDTINADRIALIGKHVINRGSLVSEGEDGYVIMAAGETVVLQADPGVSNVAVVVTLPDDVDPGDYNYWVDNGGGPFSIVDDGDGTIEADHVILAAGDIWSAAIEGVETLRAEAKGNVVFTGNILAVAGAASDAVADVTIITGGDFTVENYTIEAVAVGDGGGGFDATAGVTIEAAGELEVLGDGLVRAEASDGVDNQANVNLTGKNVTVEAEGFLDSAIVKADAHDGVTNTAGVTIIADGDPIDLDGNVLVQGIGPVDQALIRSKAENGTTKNTATVNITANDSVEVVSDGWNSSSSIKAEAVDGSENVATITIAATAGDVTLTHEGGGFLDLDRALIEAKAHQSTASTNTAIVNMTATNGNVVVTSSGNSAIKALAQNDIEINYDEDDAENSFTVEGRVNTAAVNLTGTNVEIVGVSGDATVEAIAKNEIDVDISHYDDDVTVNLDISDLENNATVTLNATDGDVLVQGGETVDVGTPQDPDEETTLGDALVAAEAYNVVDIVQHTGGWWKNPDTGWEKRDDFAATLNFTTNDLVNTALVDIDATDNIKVIADGSRRRSGSDAIVRAEAYNELVGSGCDVKDVTVYLAAGMILTDDNLFSLLNNADIQMNTTNNNVEVTALRGGFASVKADAYNIVEGVEGQIVADSGGGHGGGDIVVFVEADNIANDALVDVDAGDDVLVTAECDDRDSIAEILAYAWNDIPGEPTNEAVNITNKANINIDATNVDVKSIDGGEARIFANAYDGTDNTAGVTIYADGNVEVMHNDDAEAYIEAIATAPWGNNSTATVLIDAYANLLIDNGYVGAWANSGLNSTATVTVDAANVHVNNEGEILAEAMSYFGGEGEGDAIATVDIETTGIDGVIVENSSEILSDALALDSGNATATTTVIASNVTVNQGSGSEIGANANAQFGSGNAAATTTVTTTSSEVIVDNDSSIYSYAYADDSGDAAATTTVTAGDVTVDHGSEIYADAQAYTYDGSVVDATATTNVTTTSSKVLVDNSSYIYSYAYTNDYIGNASGDATAKTTVTADDVTVDDSSYIYADAQAYFGIGNALATVDVTTTGSEVLVEDNSYIYSYAYTDNSVDATATTTVTAGDVTVRNNSYIYSDAEAYYGLGNALATTDVTTTSSEVLVENSSEIYSYAYTDDSGDATAKTTVTAANVTVNEGSGSEIYADAQAYDGSGNALATVDVTTTGSEVIVDNDSSIYSYAYTNDSGDATAKTTVTADDVTVDNDSEIYAQAETHDGSGDALATVDVTTTGSEVEVDDGSEIRSYAYADASGDATAKTTVIADDVTVEDDSKIEAEAKATYYSVNAKADVDIDAERVEILSSEVAAKAEYSANRSVTSEMLDEEDRNDEVADVINLTVAGSATATVDITATEGDVDIISNSDAEVKAKAITDVEIDIDGGNFDDDVTVNLTVEDLTADADVKITANQDVDIEAESGEAQVWVKAENKFDVMASEGEEPEDPDVTLNLTVNKLDSDANVDITATNGDVEIWSDSDAKVKATALTKLERDIDEDVDLTETVDNVASNATVNITADGEVNVDDGKVIAEAEAQHGDGDATAGVTITAADLTVENDSRIKAEAEAEHGAGDATATVDIIMTGSDVLVEDDSKIKAEADTHAGSGDAEATVTVDAANVTVTDDSEITADAETERGSGDATALVDIDADDDVLVEDDSEIVAWAETKKYDSGNATATVDILAGGNVTVSGSEVEDEDSEVTQSGGDSSKIMAHAMTEEPKYPDSSGSAAADVIIDAGGDVTATRNGKIAAVALALSGDGQGQAGALVQPTDPVITLLPRDATAFVDIDAGGDVTVEKGSEVQAVAKIENSGMSNHIDSLENDDEIVVIVPGDATADVVIDAGGDVTVSMGSAVSAEAGIYNDAGYPLPMLDSLNGDEDGPSPLGDATATVDILAGGKVTVDMGGEVGAYAWIDNYVSFYHGPPVFDYPILPDLGDATANVYIDAGGDVTVSMGGEVYADAELYNSGGSNNTAVGSLNNDGFELPGLGDATAGIEITTPGSLTVDKGGEVYAEASIEYGEFQAPSIGGLLLLEEEADEDSGDATASVIVDAFSGVTVGERSEIAADAWINSYAFGGISDLGYLPDSAPQGDASASVDILTCGDVIVDGFVGAYADIYTQLIPLGEIESSPNGPKPGSEPVYSGDTSANVLIRAYGDVIVNSEKEEEELNGDFAESQGPSFGGQIEAVARNGEENSAAITILAVGDVIVNDGSGSFGPSASELDSSFLDSQEEIRAAAGGGHTNDAFIGIATRDDALGIDFGGDVIVSGQIGARTFDIDEGGSNTSNVEISAARDVIVNGGYAQYGSVRSEEEGDERDAVLLEAEEGGQIFAGAQSGRRHQEGTYTNTANVKIFAGRDVTVHGAEIDYVGPILPDGDFLANNGDGFYDGGQIIALTRWNDYGTNTSSIGISAQRDVAIDDATITGQPFDIDFPDTDPFDVDLAGGELIAGAHGNYSTNDADIAICAMHDVVVDGYIEATAGTGNNGVEHTAHISIAAGNLITGIGSVIADADNQAADYDAGIKVRVTASGNFQFTGEAYSTTDHGDTKIPPEVEVGSPDCPTCEFDWIDWFWCEDCEVTTGFGPAAALVPWVDLPLLLQGCPVEIEAAANELGITPGAMQLSIGNALALNPTLQACDACATLIEAALILRDEDGSRMAAMSQMFNDMAPGGSPYTPEMQALIATAFTGAAEGSQYASVMQYTDAFVRYLSVLETDLASPVGDSLAFVMDKYGAGVLGSDNTNIAAFLAASLESGQTFGN